MIKEQAGEQFNVESSTSCNWNGAACAVVVLFGVPAVFTRLLDSAVYM